MTPEGFEPSPISRPRRGDELTVRAIPEHGALDHSAKVPFSMVDGAVFAYMKLETRNEAGMLRGGGSLVLLVSRVRVSVQLHSCLAKISWFYIKYLGI